MKVFAYYQQFNMYIEAFFALKAKKHSSVLV
jgi:hypothetical protein